MSEILSDESMSYMKKLLDVKKKYDDKKKAFKEIYVKHKEELDKLEKEAAAIQEEWTNSSKDKKE